MATEVILRADESSLAEIFQLRYEIYCEELGAVMPRGDFNGRTLSDRYDEISYQYMAVREGRVIGCLRSFDLCCVSDSAELDDKYALGPALAGLGIGAITFTGRFVVRREYRRTGAALKLMAQATEDARSRGIRVAFLDCSPHLLPFYQAVGFKPYSQPFNDPIFGLKQPMLFMLGDLKGLEAIGSPLAHTGQVFSDDCEIREWYRNYYSNCSTEIDLPTAADGFPFLQGLTTTEKTLLLRRSTMLKVKLGDLIIRAHLNDDFWVIVIRGSLGLLSEQSTVRNGTFFMSRSWTGDALQGDVVALEPSTVLILDGAYIKSVLRRHSKLKKTLLKNLVLTDAETAVNG